MGKLNKLLNIKVLILLCSLHFVRGHLKQGTCPFGQLQCHNRQCITGHLFCNGKVDCRDESDEWERYCHSNIGLGEHLFPSSGGNTEDTRGVKKAQELLLKWFHGQKRVSPFTTSKWGSQISKIASALYLSDYSQFSPTHEIGNELRYELSIQVLEKLSAIDKFSTLEMASYMNGLLVTCLNPRDFHGFNLVAELRKRVDAENYTNPFEILALCNANDTMTLKDIDRVKVAYTAKKRPIWIDTQAIATLAMSCIDRKTKVFANTTTILLKTLIQDLKASQNSNGSIGGLKDTALVLQALIAANDFQSAFNIEKAIDSLLQHQEVDGSFGSFINSYYILPIFNNKSLVDIDVKHCQRPNLSDTEALDHLKRKKGEKLRIQLSLIMGKDLDFGKTWTLKVPENSSFYEVIELVASMDSKFKIRYSIAEGKPFVSAISGIEDDLELGRYWFTYVRNENSSTDINLAKESPVDVIIEENQEFILWYREGNWREN